MMPNGPLAPVVVLKNVAAVLFTCTTCDAWGIGDLWMYSHADTTSPSHDDYRGEPNPWL